MGNFVLSNDIFVNPLHQLVNIFFIFYSQESANESKNYMQEIHQLQVKLHAQSDIAFNKFKKAAMVIFLY